MRDADEGCGSHNLAFPASKIFQKHEFSGRECDWLPTHFHATLRRIDEQPPYDQDIRQRCAGRSRRSVLLRRLPRRGSRPLLRALELAAHGDDQILRLNGLDQVIVNADFFTVANITVHRAPGEENKGNHHPVRVLTHPLVQLIAVHVWHRNVCNDEI